MRHIPLDHSYPADKLAINSKQPDSAHPLVQNHYVVVVHLKFVNLADERVANSLKGNDFLEISYLVNIENFIGFRDIDFRNDFSISHSLLPTFPTGRQQNNQN